jgi:hypothetical protein
MEPGRQVLRRQGGLDGWDQSGQIRKMAPMDIAFDLQRIKMRARAVASATRDFDPSMRATVFR